MDRTNLIRSLIVNQEFYAKIFTPPGSTFEEKLCEARKQLAEMRLQALSIESRFRKYSPDQPRVPAGNPDGGQWTSEGGDDGSTNGADSDPYGLNGLVPADNDWGDYNPYLSSEDNNLDDSGDTLLAANDGMPGDHQRQNKQIDAIQNKLGFDDDQREELHREISGQNMGYLEIMNRAIEKFGIRK